MTTLRPGRTIRPFKIPYSRKSKYKSSNYAKVSQQPKITQYISGNNSQKFDLKIAVLSKQQLQIRENALEAARIVANKYLTDNVGDQNFKLILVSFPHQILREHKLATGAGADRFSSGMQKSFGKPTGFAARVRAGDRVFEIHLNNDHLNEAKTAAVKIGKKLGVRTLYLVSKNGSV